VRGRALARPAIIRGKDTPIDSEVPLFWKVARIPAEANQRTPNRSDRAPDSGPATKNPAVSGSRKIPAHNGVWL
jgi:hypothetical protein